MRPTRKFFTVPQLADLLGMTPGQCGRELEKAEVPVRQRGGPGTWRRIWLSDLETHWPEAWANVERG